MACIFTMDAEKAPLTLAPQPWHASLRRGFRALAHGGLGLAGLFMLLHRLLLVGIFLHVFLRLSGYPVWAHALPGVLCMAYLALVLLVLAALLAQGGTQAAAGALGLALKHSSRLHGGGWLALLAWIGTVALFDKPQAQWVIVLYAVCAVLALVWMLLRMAQRWQ